MVFRKTRRRNDNLVRLSLIYDLPPVAVIHIEDHHGNILVVGELHLHFNYAVKGLVGDKSFIADIQLDKAFQLLFEPSRCTPSPNIVPSSSSPLLLSSPPSLYPVTAKSQGHSGQTISYRLGGNAFMHAWVFII